MKHTGMKEQEVLAVAVEAETGRGASRQGEAPTIEELLAKAMEAEGAVTDTVTDLVDWGVDYPLSRFTLYISARGGLRVEHLYTAPKPYIVAIPLPDDCTAGQLIAALVDQPGPAFILALLRKVPGGDKYIMRKYKEHIDVFVASFVETLGNPTNHETLNLVTFALSAGRTLRYQVVIED